MIGRRRGAGVGRAAVFAAAMVVTAAVPLAASGDPAAAQEPGAPVLTTMTASSGYLTDPCCFVYIEVEWTTDPSGPPADRFRVTYGSFGTNVVAGDARADANPYVPDDVDVEVRVQACAGPVATEVCSERSTTVRTATSVPPIVEVTNLMAWPTGPDQFTVTWGAGRTNISGQGYTRFILSSSDPPTSYNGFIQGASTIWDGARPGSTYSMSVERCIGPTPTSVTCGFARLVYAFPATTGTLAGTVLGSGTRGGRPVLAYAPFDGLMPTGATLTHADGSYVFHGLPEGEYAIVATGATGGNTASTWYGGSSRATAALQTVTTGSSIDGLDVTLLPATAIRGTVTAGGVPLAGATVWGFAEGDTWMGSIVGTTGADGRFVIREARPGRYQVAVVRPGTVGTAGWYGAPDRRNASWVEVGSTPVDGIDLVLTP